MRSLQRRGRERMRLRHCLAWIGALASLGWISLAFHALSEGSTPDWPRQMLNGVPSWRFLTEAMMTLDRIAVPIAGASLLAFVAVHAVKRQWQAMMALVILAAGGAFLSQCLKALVGRARPPGVALVEVGGYSFPSGQVLAFTLVAGWAIHMASTSSASVKCRNSARFFLPRGLRDTCPQVMGDLRAARLPGRCPTTLNASGGLAACTSATAWPVELAHADSIERTRLSPLVRSHF